LKDFLSSKVNNDLDIESLDISVDLLFRNNTGKEVNENQLFHYLSTYMVTNKNRRRIINGTSPAVNVRKSTVKLVGVGCGGTIIPDPASNSSSLFVLTAAHYFDNYFK